MIELLKDFGVNLLASAVWVFVAYLWVKRQWKPSRNFAMNQLHRACANLFRETMPDRLGEEANASFGSGISSIRRPIVDSIASYFEERMGHAAPEVRVALRVKWTAAVDRALATCDDAIARYGHTLPTRLQNQLLECRSWGTRLTNESYSDGTEMGDALFRIAFSMTVQTFSDFSKALEGAADMVLSEAENNARMEQLLQRVRRSI